MALTHESGHPLGLAISSSSPQPRQQPLHPPPPPPLSVPPPLHSLGQMSPTCCTSSPRGVTSPLLVRSRDWFGMRDKLPQSDALRGDLVIQHTTSSFGIC